MIAYLRDWLLYRDIITVSARDSFEGMNPRDIEELLDACTPESGIAPQPTDSVKKFRYLPKCAPALVRIWELAEKEYHKDRFNASVWQQIMARCNALYQLSLNKSSAAEIKSVIHA